MAFQKPRPPQPNRPLSQGALFLSMVFGGACVGSPVPAQTIPDEPSCAGCEINFEVLAEFGHKLDDGLIQSEFVGVYALADGSFVTTDVVEKALFRFYDAQGSFLRLRNSYGRGPGEFIAPSDIFRTTDGYAIFDVRLARLTWVNEDFEFLRSVPLGISASRISLLPDEAGVVVNALTTEGAPQGHTLQVMGFDGSKTVFGGEGRPVDLRSSPKALDRVMTLDAQGKIWASKVTEYQVKRYSPSGDELMVLEREGDLFPDGPYSPIPRDVRDGPPSPRMRNLVVDPDGLLWAFYLVPGPEWEVAVEEYGPEESRDYEKLWDTVVEVIDPSAGRLLARTRVDQYLADVEMTEASGQVLMFYVDEKDTGFQGVTVLRFSLDGRPEA